MEALLLEEGEPRGDRRVYLTAQYSTFIAFVLLSWQFTHAWKAQPAASLFGDVAEVLGYVIIMASLLSFAEVEKVWGTYRVPLNVCITRKAKMKSMLSHVAYVFEKTNIRRTLRYVKETATPVSNFVVGPLQRLFYFGVRISRINHLEKVQVVSRRRGIVDYSPKVPLKCASGLTIPSITKARLENNTRANPFCRPYSSEAILQRYGTPATVIDFSSAVVATGLLTLAQLL